MEKKEKEFDYNYFLGKTLARQRNRLGWNQEAAAEKMRIHPSTLSRLETGNKPITEEILFMMCRVMEISVVAVASEASDLYQAHLSEKERLLPSRPAVAQVIERYKLYAQSRHEEHEKEGEFLQSLLNYLERLRTAP